MLKVKVMYLIGGVYGLPFTKGGMYALEIRVIEGYKPKEKKKLRVAAYARVSTDRDNQQASFNSQKSYYEELVNSNPDWTLVGIYADEGISGVRADRPELQRLLQDCRARKLDMIITKSITRFARNTTTLIELLRELKSIRVDVYFEKEKIHSISEEGEFLLTLLGSFAEAESFSISENNRWAFQKRFEQGKAVTCNVYGYTLSGGRFEIIPEEAEVVKYIFARYLEGVGNKTIARELNEKGIPTKHGKTWTAGTIYDMLRNEKYLGNMKLGISYIDNYVNQKKVINHGERPIYEVIGSHEAIIDQATFDATQAEIKARVARIRPRKPNGIYQYTSLIKCGKCGKHYVHFEIQKEGKDYEHWICQTYMFHGKDECPSQRIPVYALDEKTKEVLGVEDLENINVKDYVREIVVPEKNKLIYYLMNDEVFEVSWQFKKPEHKKKKDKHYNGNSNK